MEKLKEEILLGEKKCGCCKTATGSLEPERCDCLLGQLSKGWAIEDDKLEKEFAFKDFRQGLEMVNAVGALAEAQMHHPDIFLAWGKVKITLYTHRVGGLTEDDFIFAAKVDQLQHSPPSCL